jgi:hypothetical protein
MHGFMLNFVATRGKSTPKLHRVFVRNAPRCFTTDASQQTEPPYGQLDFAQATWDQYARASAAYFRRDVEPVCITDIWTVNDDVYALALPE